MFKIEFNSVDERNKVGKCQYCRRIRQNRADGFNSTNLPENIVNIILEYSFYCVRCSKAVKYIDRVDEVIENKPEYINFQRATAYDIQVYCFTQFNPFPEYKTVLNDVLTFFSISGYRTNLIIMYSKEVHDIFKDLYDSLFDGYITECAKHHLLENRVDTAYGTMLKYTDMFRMILTYLKGENANNKLFNQFYNGDLDHEIGRTVAQIWLR